MSFDDDDYEKDRKGRRPRKRGDNPFDDFFNNFRRSFGFDDMNFDNIFEYLDNFFNDFFRQVGFDRIFGDFGQEGQSGFPGFIWGIRMTSGPDGRPHFERFGHSPRKGIGKSGHIDPNEREPLVDVIDNGDSLVVIAEVPGVSKKDIDLSATETSLLIKAQDPQGQRKYYKELNLPSRVDPKTARAKFKNGVLEVELTKIKIDPQKGSRVRVE